MNKFQTGQKWLRSDGKICVIKVWDDDSISDQDGLEYTYGGYSYRGLNLVSRVVSDDELVEAFLREVAEVDNTLSGDESRKITTAPFYLETLMTVSKRLQAQQALLTELKQLISDSQVKGAAMITKIEEL